jgi:altronate dehydratase
MKDYRFIIIDAKDNCATAFEEIPQNSNVKLDNKEIIINQAIPFGHKFALRNIDKDDFVMKYGEIIGIATKNIREGDWIHIHNITSYYLQVKDNG